MKTKYETIIVDQEDGIAKITLNIPETLNAMTQKLGEEVVEAARNASEDSNVKVVILTGAGRGFCSGANLSTFGVAELGPMGTLIMARKLPEAVVILRAMPKPFITAVNGPAAGAGLSFALAGDFIIASDKASFTTVFVLRGIHPDCGLTFLLPRLVGTAKACELLMTGRKVLAEEAKSIGMVTDVVPADNLDSTVMDLARKLTKMAPIALGLIKRSLYASLDMDLPMAIEAEARAQTVCGITEDAQEGANAFLEKREPVFKGR